MKRRLAYEILVRAAQGRHGESALALVEAAAEFAWYWPPGRLRDARLERVIDREAPIVGAVELDIASDSVLHIATEVHSVGGHAALLDTWRRLDPRPATVVLTNQAVPLPAAFRAATTLSGSRMDRVAELRRMVQQHARVIVHQHPFDPVPRAAMAGTDGRGIGVLNHADHVFWLTPAARTWWINLRHQAVELNRRYRSSPVEAQLELPIPLSTAIDPGSGARSQIRADLGLSEDSVVLMTMANEYKFGDDPHFLDLMMPVLQANP
jgi:hypothetical protein